MLSRRPTLCDRWQMTRKIKGTTYCQTDLMMKMMMMMISLFIFQLKHMTHAQVLRNWRWWGRYLWRWISVSSVLTGCFSIVVCWHNWSAWTNTHMHHEQAFSTTHYIYIYIYIYIYSNPQYRSTQILDNDQRWLKVTELILHLRWLLTFHSPTIKLIEKLNTKSLYAIFNNIC